MGVWLGLTVGVCEVVGQCAVRPVLRDSWPLRIGRQQVREKQMHFKICIWGLVLLLIGRKAALEINQKTGLFEVK